LLPQATIQIADSTVDAVEVLPFIYGAMFFGVPNCGLNIESFIEIVGDGPNRALVECLGRDNSQVLDTQRKKFLKAFDFKGNVSRGVIRRMA
jgi:hypothetical protein